jgi:WD40 repeat protein
LLASTWDERTIHVTDVARHQDIQSFTLGSPIQALTWSSEPGVRRLLVYTEDGTFVSATTAALTKVHVTAPRAAKVVIGELRDYRPLLGLVLDGFKIQFRTVSPDAVRTEVSHDQPIGVTFRADGRVAATSGYDGRVNIWNVQGSSHGPDVLVHDEPISFIAFSPDGRRVAFADNFGGVVVRELASKRDEFQVRLDSPVSALAFSPDGRWLVGGGTVARLWDLGTGRELARMVDEGSVSNVTFRHDGGQVAVAGEKAIRIWSFPAQLPVDPPGIVSALAVSERGDVVYVGDSYGNIDVITLEPRPSVVHLVQVSGQESAVRALSMGGAVLTAAFDDGAVRTWRAGVPIDHRPLVTGVDPILTMAVTSEGQTFAAGDWDGNIRLVKYDGSVVPSDQLEQKTGIDALAFVGRAQHLAIVTAGRVDVWDWRTKPRIIASRAANGSTLAFSSDGKLLLVGDPSGARVLSWDTGTATAQIDTYAIPTAGAFFRADEYLVLGSGNKAARRVVIVPLSRSALIREGCARLRAYYR